MKKIFLFIISLVLGVFIFGLVVKKAGIGELVEIFKSFSGWGWCLVLFFTFLVVPISLWRWKIILKGQGYNVSLGKLRNPFLISYSLNYLIPSAFLGSEFFRGYLIKKNSSVPFAKGLASIVIDKIADLLVGAIMVIIGLFVLLCLISAPFYLWIVLGILILIYVIIFSILCLNVSPTRSIVKKVLKLFGTKENKKNKVMVEVEQEVLGFFNWKEKRMWQGIGIGFLKVTVLLTRCWIIIFFLGKQFNFFIIFPVLGSSVLSLIFFFPASIGSNDALQAMVFGSLGVGADAGTAFAIFLRGANVFLAFIGLIALFHSGFRLFKIKMSEKLDNMAINNNKE